MPVEANIKASIEFLEKYSPGGPWWLTSISPDKKSLETRTYRKETVSDLRKWLEGHAGKNNIYFSVNEPNGELSKKASKENIAFANWLHVDVDPADPPPGTEDVQEFLTKEREKVLALFTDKLPKGIPDPTVILFSGGGYQAFWKLDEKVSIDGDIKKAEEFEQYNRRLEQIFGGDHCHNVDRIMRLPGSVNVPDAKKRKKGRTEQTAVLLQFNTKKYSLKDFKPAQNVQITGARAGSSGPTDLPIPGNVERIQDLAELDQWDVPDRLKVIIAQGHHPDQPKQGDNSRSAWLFDCVCSLVRLNVPDNVIFSIITDPDWGISSSVVEMKGGADRYAMRQIARAKEHSDDPNLMMMNDRHAIIGNIGGKCRVIEEIEDSVLHRSRLTLSSFEDIRNRYSHINVQVGSDKDGDAIWMSLGKFWLMNAKRRQYDTMAFMPQGDKPGVYNLWRGFAVQPVPGDCSLYLDHIKNNVCSGNEEYFQYLIKWMARAIQNPASPGEVAVVLRGGKGAGKGTVAKIFGRLFGRHYLQVANPSHLVGNFNAHLRDVLFLFADEAFFAGDKRHESVLKMLVTEDSIPIEAKGVDVESYPNYVHLIMAANDLHVIRASGDERRYFVLNVGEDKKQDAKYFAKMHHQMENGGYEALLHYLQEVDLTDFEVRIVPQTDALQEQKLFSMSVDEEWWYRKLTNGRLTDSDETWREFIPCDHLIADFTAYAEKWKFTRRGNETALGRFLLRVCPDMIRDQKRVSVDELDEYNRPKTISKRVYVYEFGSLEKCRKEWERLYGKVKWSDPRELDLGPKDDDTPF